MAYEEASSESNVLLKVDDVDTAITKQETVLRSMQAAHGEFHVKVSDDLGQLALLYNMNGEYDKALPLLHKRLVIHEKSGLDELTSETLQELGTVYRLHGVPDIAQQHLQRALTIREKCHGKNSLKVAETLNSLALVRQAINEAHQAEDYQLQSLQVLFESSEPEDIESEDVPWEVYKRLKQQRGPCTAENSITLLKGNMRKCVTELLYANKPSGKENGGQFESESVLRSANFQSENINESPTPSKRLELPMFKRATRSHSDSAMKLYRAKTEKPFGDIEDESHGIGLSTVSYDANVHSDSVHRSGAKPMVRERGVPQRTNVVQNNLSSFLPSPSHERMFQPIHDLESLQYRVDIVKHRILMGSPDVDSLIARLTSDVDLIQPPDLRQVGITMISLVSEMNRLCMKSDSARQLPVLEGVLEKKSASIFRGWEKRWFKVDPKTFIVSYHFSMEDHARGFAPRGGFSVSRISNILVHRHARGNHYHFDVVVDLRTKANPHGSRTYELRCDDENILRYWVETLHYYKAIAQSTPARPSTS